MKPAWQLNAGPGLMARTCSKAIMGAAEEEISGLLSREAANSFGIMAPSGPQVRNCVFLVFLLCSPTAALPALHGYLAVQLTSASYTDVDWSLLHPMHVQQEPEKALRLQGERRVRGSGIYPQASLLNHDCLPNVARFDNFDSAAFGQTQLEFRALHDLPAGQPICCPKDCVWLALEHA